MFARRLDVFLVEFLALRRSKPVSIIRPPSCGGHDIGDARRLEHRGVV